MKRTSFSVIYFVKRTRSLRTGELPIYARITINGERAEFTTQSCVKEEQWDNVRNRMRGTSKEAKDLNLHLDGIKSKLIEIKMDMENHKEDLTALALRDRFMGIETKNKTLLTIFQEHNDKCKGLINKDFAPGTVERYETCYRLLEFFIKDKYKKNDVHLHEINPMFINNFEYYLKTKRNCCNNTTVKYIKNFRKIIRIALANGWMKSDPFSNLKYHIDDVDMAYLTENELNIMINKRFTNERLAQVKDIYLFSCFTGLAFIDTKQLTYDEIENKDGSLWIKKKRQKTKNWCNIPLLQPAIEIMNKYKNHPTCIKNGVVLPVLSNQKMNSYLKEIADMCGIEKKLSTHTARHTFATTVTLANKVSMEVVSKMLGHSNMIMTKKYARVVDDLINKDMQQVMTKYQTAI